MDGTGWTSELPRIPGYYWVRLPGYERAPTIAEIELHEGVLEIMHEGLDGPRGWVPLEQEYGPEHLVACLACSEHAPLRATPITRQTVTTAPR